MIYDADYSRALTNRLVEDLNRKGVKYPWLRDLIYAHVQDVLREIQHRIYQHVAANLLDLAKQIYPPGERRS